MLPFTVESESPPPDPLPILPAMCLRPILPFTVSGKSLEMSPFRVFAVTSALSLGGKVTLMPPFTVLNSISSVQVATPTEAETEPLTVVA